MLHSSCPPHALVVPQRGYCAGGVIAGEFVVEPATLHCLGFEWRIQGDDNHNAQVSVRYRPAGQQQWQEGLPMVRIVYQPSDDDFRLRAGGAAIDAGEELPTINDGFIGKAPDLGAYEFDQPLPTYGPRPGSTSLKASDR